MSPIDQAFLKAFANRGRPSAVAAAAPLPTGTARSADAPKPAAATTARAHDSASAADLTARLASKAVGVSAPRITLSEAIALRQAQQVAVASTPQREADSPSTTYQSEAVEHRPLAAEPQTADPAPAVLAATAIDASRSTDFSFEGAPTNSFDVDAAKSNAGRKAQNRGESVAEATAARLAQLTALWDAAVAGSETGVAKPLPTDVELRPAVCRPEERRNGEGDQAVEAEARENRSPNGFAGNEQAPATAPSGVESQPIDADDATARIDQPQQRDSDIQSSCAEQHPDREPRTECRSPAESKVANLSDEHAATGDATNHAVKTIAGECSATGVAKAAQRDDAAEAAPILKLLRPAIQLERFAWPSLISRWMRGCSEQLDGVVDALFRAARNEQRIIGFSSCRPGEGVSSVVLATARQLSRRQSRFAVIEGNWDAPQFARRLALLSNEGWEAVIEGRRDLTDVMVGADEGRAAIVPALRAPSGKADPPRIAETYDLLRQNYEIVLVDLPPRGQGAQCLGTLCDTVVLVQHPRQTRQRELQQYAEQWSSAGVGVLGVVQNGLN